MKGPRNASRRIPSTEECGALQYRCGRLFERPPLEPGEGNPKHGRFVYIDMVVPQTGGTQDRHQYTLIVVAGTPKMVPLTLGNLHGKKNIYIYTYMCVYLHDVYILWHPYYLFRA